MRGTNTCEGAYYSGGRVAGLSRHIVSDRVRHEPHAGTTRHASRLHVLQLVLSHLLVDGLILHTVRRHAGALLEDVPNDSPEGATVDAAAPTDAERAQRRRSSQRRGRFERHRQKNRT